MEDGNKLYGEAHSLERSKLRGLDSSLGKLPAAPASGFVVFVMCLFVYIFVWLFFIDVLILLLFVCCARLGRRLAAVRASGQVPVGQNRHLRGLARLWA